MQSEGNMKKITISIITIIGSLLLFFLFNCSANKNIPLMDNSLMKPKNDGFDYYFEKYSGNLKKISNENREYSRMIKTDYNFNRENVLWKLNVTNKSEDDALIDVVSPMISPDGKFVVAYKRKVTLQSGSDFYNYKIMVLHVKSGIECELFSSDERQFVTDMAKLYPAVSWAPFGNCFAFTANHNNINNVFIAFIEYDLESSGINFILYQITKNSEDNYYYDFDWSEKGDLLSFTKTNAYDASEIMFYDINEKSLSAFPTNGNSGSFRFGKKNKKTGFFIMETGGFYSAYLLDDFLNPETKSKIPNIVSKNPFFCASFSESTKQVAVLNIDQDNQFKLSIYNYGNKQISDMSLNTSSDEIAEYLPLGNPVWIFNDNFILINLKDYVCSAFVNENYVMDNQIEYNKLIQDDNELINAINKGPRGKLYYSAFDRKFYIFNFELILKKDLRIDDILERFYTTQIIEYNDITKIAKIQREGTPIPPSKMIGKKGSGYIQKKAKKEIVLYLYSGKKIELKNNKIVNLKWPQNIKAKTINVKIVEAISSTTPNIQKH